MTSPTFPPGFDLDPCVAALAMTGLPDQETYDLMWAAVAALVDTRPADVFLAARALVHLRDLDYHEHKLVIPTDKVLKVKPAVDHYGGILKAAEERLDAERRNTAGALNRSDTW